MADEPPFISTHHGVPFAVKHDDRGWWIAIDEDDIVGPFTTATQADGYARDEIRRRHAG
jgi:hypothetical protein